MTPDSEQEVKSHKRLTTYPINLSNDTVIALWDGRWRVTAHDLHRLHMVKHAVEFRRDPAAATPAFVVYKEQRTIHHSQETLVIPGSLTKVFFDRGSETATREETYEVRVTRITWSEDLTRCEIAYNVTGRNSYGEVVDDDDEISFDMELDEDQHIYLHSFPLGAVNFLKIE
jgi:hypothetical protein